MSKKREAFGDQIRKLIASSGQTQYAICKATGIQPATLNKFMNRNPGAGLSVANLNRLAEHFGWVIVVDDNAGPQRKR
jgi:transcriptional regulator with XRE-family HTH domain